MIVPFDVELERLAQSSSPQASVWLRDGAVEVVGGYWAARVSVLDADDDVEGPIDPEALRLAREAESEIVATRDTLQLPHIATFERDLLGWERRTGYRELREQLLDGLPQPTRFTVDTRALAELATALDAHEGLVEIELRAPYAALVIRPISKEGYYDHTELDGAPDPHCEALLMPSPISTTSEHSLPLPTVEAEGGATAHCGWRTRVEATLAQRLRGSCDAQAIERWLDTPRHRLDGRSPREILTQATGEDDPRVEAVLELASPSAGPYRAPLSAGQARQLARRTSQLAHTLATTPTLTPETISQARAIAHDATTIDWSTQYSSRPMPDAHTAITTLNHAIDTNSRADIETALRQLTTIADHHAATPHGTYTDPW